IRAAPGCGSFPAWARASRRSAVDINLDGVRTRPRCTLQLQASVPIPKFARLCGNLGCELRNQRDTSNSMILVPLFEPEVRNRFCNTMCANFGFGALASRDKMKRTVRSCVVAIVAVLVANGAFAQTAFPTRPVRFIVPFPGGGINDVLARIVGDKLQAKWGQPIVVENQTGAGGNIGADLAYQPAPDGYTLLLSPPGPPAVQPTRYNQLSYHPQSLV